MSKPINLSVTLLGLCLLAGLAFDVSAQDPKLKAKGVNDALPRPDGKPADVSKTVKVFILMGQSNMLEMGTVAGDKGRDAGVRGQEGRPVPLPHRR